MKSLMDLEGSAVDIAAPVVAETDDRVLLKLRGMVAATLRSKGLTFAQVGRVLNVSEQHAGRIAQAVPPWQQHRAREIIDEAVCELLD